MTHRAMAALRRDSGFCILAGLVLLVFLGAFAMAVARTDAQEAGVQTAAPPTAAETSPAQSGSAPEGQKAPAAPAPDRRFIGETRCANCHEDQGARYTRDVHSRKWDPRTPGADRACESCHGPARPHFEDPEAPGLIRHFPRLSPAAVNETCTTCHNRMEHSSWAGSTHDARNMSCLSCHSIHGSRSEPLLREVSLTSTCADCHREKAAKLQRSAHMPVREGKMECTTCHNPHGSTNVRLLRAGNTVNESCTSCHAEKRGPFLWDHPPVRESCVTCHDPHGSSNDRMLVARTPMLCQRCHVATRHPSTVYDQTAFRTGSIRVIGRGCVNCHSSIHGSNHPAGIMFQR